MPVDGIVPLTMRARLDTTLVRFGTGATGEVRTDDTNTLEDGEDVWFSVVLALSVTLNPNA